MNVIWILLVLGAVFTALVGGKMDGLTGAMLQSAKSAVELAIGLVGSLCLWLGLMRIVERAGLLAAIARGMEPILRRLFPSVPKDHPALGAIMMNFSANLLGMDNAATAFGLRAMRALNALNARPGVATNAMVMFMAVNTAGIQAFPINVVAARAALNPQTAGRVVVPTLLVTILSMGVAIAWTRVFERLRRFSFESAPVAPGASAPPAEEDGVAAVPLSEGGSRRDVWLARAGGVALAGLLAYRIVADARAGAAAGDLVRAVAGWALPLLAAAMLLYGLSRGVRAYEAAVEGAKQGFEIAVRIIPFLVMILVAVGMMRASGAMDALTAALEPFLAPLGMPAAVLPQALIRPLSGSAAMGLLVDTLKAYGPDSIEGLTASVIYGSSETTFYVLTVYFGAVGVRSLRHALLACLLSDVSGMFIACWVARAFL